MAEGWRLTSGNIRKYGVGENEFWPLFRNVLSDTSKKNSTYKYGLLKSILDNLLSVKKADRGMELSLGEIFAKFAENYWNLITKYHLKQMHANSRYSCTEIEKIYQKAIEGSPLAGELDFGCLPEKDRYHIIADVTSKCKRCVVGALYEEFDGCLYGFSFDEGSIWISPAAYEFMLKYKPEIEQLNYYAWAKFLEKVNSDDVLVRVLSKLDQSTPRRNDLSVYRDILWKEFEDNHCFYCGCKLKRSVHVDHVIPWSFVKEDHLWNFVLACPRCNEKKNNKLPSEPVLARVIIRNEQLSQQNSSEIEDEFSGYNPSLLRHIWDYAKLSGLKEFSSK